MAHLGFDMERTISSTVINTANAASKDRNQARHQCENRFETGPAERQINLRHVTSHLQPRTPRNKRD
jgi:hypothetical protein